MPADKAVRRRVLVHGRVQGVFYRATLKERATERGVTGWARNLSGGRVEAVFEGPPEEIDSLIEWCRTGPGMAEVTGVEIHNEEPLGESGFTTR